MHISISKVGPYWMTQQSKYFHLKSNKSYSKKGCQNVQLRRDCNTNLARPSSITIKNVTNDMEQHRQDTLLSLERNVILGQKLNSLCVPVFS